MREAGLLRLGLGELHRGSGLPHQQALRGPGAGVDVDHDHRGGWSAPGDQGGHSPPASVPAPRRLPPAFGTTLEPDRGLWRELAGLGLLGMMIPEPLGGTGAGLLEAALAAEQAGPSCRPCRPDGAGSGPAGLAPAASTARR
ncbi:acyl-CoA dehydrogenase family protein, partial [Streptomyces sp. NPDC004599]